MPDTPVSQAKSDSIFTIDCDVHVSDVPGALAPYCEMPWRRSLEVLASSPRLPQEYPGYSPFLILDPPFPDVPGRQVETPEQMREGLDMIGVDIGILFPDHLLNLAMFPDSNYALALARAFNEWMVDHWLSDEYGLRGALVVAPQDPAASARDIERYAKERNVVALDLPACGVDPLYGNRIYDPIYQAAQDADLPVMLHAVEGIFPAFPFNFHKVETAFARHAMSHPFSMMANMISIINTGVMVRFPRLKIAFLEAGVSWVPWVMYRLDKEFTERRREVPFLTERPSAYIKRFYYGTQPIEEPEPLRDLVTVFQLFDGEDNVMFASDWPHHDFDHPSKILQAPFSTEAKRKIMAGNAIRFFDLKELTPKVADGD